MRSANSQAFNPWLYSSINNTETILEDSADVNEKFDEIVTKGGKKVFKVDIGHFDKLCRRFKDICDTKIKNLRGRDKEDFNLMVSYVHLLYGTSYYKHFYKKVEKYFSKLDRVIPGTVGGYFGGCLVSTSFEDQPGCSAACAGSVPRPKGDEGWSFCDKAVVFAEYNGNRYSFSMLKEPEREEDMDPCYLFVEHTDLHDFEGFSKNEKDELKKMGVDYVHLIGCDEKGTEYVDLYDDVRSVDDIKHRKRYWKDSDNSSLGLALILIIIFLFLIVLFFGWRFWNKDGSNIYLQW